MSEETLNTTPGGPDSQGLKPASPASGDGAGDGGAGGQQKVRARLDEVRGSYKAKAFEDRFKTSEGEGPGFRELPLRDPVLSLNPFFLDRIRKMLQKQRIALIECGEIRILQE